MTPEQLRDMRGVLALLRGGLDLLEELVEEQAAEITKPRSYLRVVPDSG